MKNLLWIATVFLAFAAGYFTHGANQEAPSAATKTIQPIDTAIDPQVSREQLSAAAKAVFAAKEKVAPKTQQTQNPLERPTESAVTPQTATAPSPAQAVDAKNPTEKKYPNEISDEDIDKILPAPFNSSLKNVHGSLREKYKDFSETEKQDPWDVNMQNKITDYLMGNAYSKFLTVEAVNCKINFCEIRAIELKAGVSNLMFSEMSMQDWWDIGPSQWMTTNNKGAGTLYALLQRK
jgi:hypothetical protein